MEAVLNTEADAQLLERRDVPRDEESEREEEEAREEQRAEDLGDHLEIARSTWRTAEEPNSAESIVAGDKRRGRSGPVR